MPWQGRGSGRSGRQRVHRIDDVGEGERAVDLDGAGRPQDGRRLVEVAQDAPELDRVLAEGVGVVRGDPLPPSGVGTSSAQPSSPVSTARGPRSARPRSTVDLPGPGIPVRSTRGMEGHPRGSGVGAALVVIGESVKAQLSAFVESVTGALAENPRRAGKPLAGGLSGLWAARRGQYRVVYAIADEVIAVTILRIARRSTTHRWPRG